MNSDITAIFRDLSGRIAAGEALSRIENTVQEAKELMIIDPRKLNEDIKKEIEAAISDIMNFERNLIPQKSDGTFFDLNAEYVKKRRRLNKAVLKGIGYVKSNSFQCREIMVERPFCIWLHSPFFTNDPIIIVTLNQLLHSFESVFATILINEPQCKQHSFILFSLISCLIQILSVLPQFLQI